MDRRGKTISSDYGWFRTATGRDKTHAGAELRKKPLDPVTQRERDFNLLPVPFQLAINSVYQPSVLLIHWILIKSAG